MILTVNDTNDDLQGNEYKTLIAEAHSDFQQSVINGISKLRESGFSKQRAIEILLTFVRQKDPIPSDDEIFQVMHTLRLGFHHAMQCLTVAKAVSRIQQIGGLEKVQAIQSLSKDITRYIQEFSIPILLDQQNIEASHSITTEDVTFLKVNLSSSHATTTRKGPSTPSSVVHPPTHTANGSSTSTGSNTNTSTKSNSTHHSIRNATNVKKSLPRTNKQIRKRKDEEENVVSGVVGTKEEREHIRKSSPKRSTRNKRIREDETSTGHASNGNGTVACHAASGSSNNNIPETILVDGNLMVSSKRPRLDSV